MTEPRIHPSSTIGPDVTMGPDVTIGPDCHIVGGTTIGARVIIEQGVRIGGRAVVGDDCVVGLHVSIGACAQIAAGTTIERDVPPHAIVEGRPAAIVGFGAPVRNARRLLEGDAGSRATAIATTSIDGVAVHRFPLIRDRRGDLTVGEFDHNVPFRPERYFLVSDVPDGEFRGGHAHLTCAELLICVSGSLAVVVDDGVRREEIELDTPDVALCLRARVWATQYRHAPGTVLLVFASHHYDAHDYIRDYQRFLAETRPDQGPGRGHPEDR